MLPSRYGFDPAHLKQADAIEVVIGQGAKPGTGGLLLGAKVSPVIADQRTLPEGVDQRSPVRHPDFIGPDDLQIKIEELREATNWEKPIYVKMGASRVSDDVKLAVKAGADVIVLDGLEGATGATPEILLDHTAIPTMGALVEAVHALEELRVLGEVQLVISGGIKNGADAAKALALGADAVSIGTAALIAMGADAPNYVDDFHQLGYEPGDGSIWHTGLDPTGIATQEPELEARLDLEHGRRPGLQLHRRHDHGAADAGPGLRQGRRPRPRARGHAGADLRGLDDHRDPVGRHRLRPHPRRHRGDGWRPS